MRKIIVLPVAGKSTRYPQKEPKWFLKHPSGNYMLTEAIKGINKDFEEIYIIGIEKHNNYIDKVKEEMIAEFGMKVRSLKLKEQTRNQPETVFKGLERLFSKPASILIKDSDGYFEFPEKLDWKSNFVSVYNLKKCNRINAGNKSYVMPDTNNMIGNIIEKEVIGNLFSCGGYYFQNSDEFLKYYEKGKDKNYYISHIIYRMLTEKINFKIVETKNYHDWGTMDDWIEYKRKLNKDKSIVLDLDGTLIKLEEKPYLDRKIINQIVDRIKEYKKKGFYVIIETSRNMNTYRQNVGLITKNTIPIIFEQLEKCGIPYDEIRIGKAWEGKNGFRVDDKTIRPTEFLEMDYDKIMEKLEKDRI